jgi:hypothetical protein
MTAPEFAANLETVIIAARAGRVSDWEMIIREAAAALEEGLS